LIDWSVYFCVVVATWLLGEHRVFKVCVALQLPDICKVVVAGSCKHVGPWVPGSAVHLGAVFEYNLRSARHVEVDNDHIRRTFGNNDDLFLIVLVPIGLQYWSLAFENNMRVFKTPCIEQTYLPVLAASDKSILYVCEAYSIYLLVMGNQLASHLLFAQVPNLTDTVNRCSCNKIR